MRVQEILLENSKKYMLIDEKGIPIVPVVKYLKYLDSTGKSRNTQKDILLCLKTIFFIFKRNREKLQRNKTRRLSRFCWLVTSSVY